ncbi:hypothetical protein [Pseudomonas sp. FP2300]|uniref:hypothetical protein n=1 Tax=Pseudomonas sp. FP2300 TaxID=2954090 RepID=UPI002732A2EB|nr:hypothetical protein [Pseudomonas sp. FP2300]WLH64843.1 hypothetical protein PSH86_09840 [Pseudomonas sp. FP2300]
MSEQYEPNGRYNVIDPDGEKIGEVVKGVLYQGAPSYREEVGTISFDGKDEGLTFEHNGAVFKLELQESPEKSQLLAPLRELLDGVRFAVTNEERLELLQLAQGAVFMHWRTKAVTHEEFEDLKAQLLQADADGQRHVARQGVAKE